MSNPARILILTDTDGDGLLDKDEINIHGTDPNKRDSDGDGLSDGEEIIVFETNPNVKDSDEDGFSDYSEVYSGKDPLDPADFPLVLLSAFYAIEIEFPSKLGDWYQIQITPDLNLWKNFGSPIEGTGDIIRKLYSTREHPIRSYRVEVVPPPEAP